MFPAVVSWQEIHFLHIEWRNLVSLRYLVMCKSKLLFRSNINWRREVYILKNEGCETLYCHKHTQIYVAKYTDKHMLLKTCFNYLRG